MAEIIVTIDDEKYTKSFVTLLRELKYVSSFKKSKNSSRKLKPLTDADWVRPGRPATSDEISQMLEEAEKAPFYSLEEAKELTLKEFDECLKRTHRKKVTSIQ